MDWKREAADKLRTYEAKRTSIKISEERIERLKSDITRIRSASEDGTQVSGGTNVRDDVVVNNIAEREEMRIAKELAKRSVEMIETALKELDDTERLLLDRFYIHRAKGNVERLCEELAVEKTTVYRWKDQALRHFTLALYGVVET